MSDTGGPGGRERGATARAERPGWRAVAGAERRGRRAADRGWGAARADDGGWGAAARAADRGWGAALRAVVGLFLPVECIGCGAPDRAVCDGCRRQLDALPRRVRLVAGVRTDAAFEYQGLVRVLLLEFKLRGRVDVAGALAGRFGRLVDEAVAAAPAGTVVLLVPPSARGARRRGFDPVRLLLRRGTRGRGAAGAAGAGRAGSDWRSRAARAGRGAVPGAVRARADRPAFLDRSALAARPALVRLGGVGPRLVRVRGARAEGQKERTATERVAATVGSLRAEGVRGRTVVVVDDVVTTGVTMAEAVRAVRAAGGTVVRCVAVASVED